MERCGIIKIRLSDTVPHERIRADYVRVLADAIKTDRALRRPIAVYLQQGQKRYVIIDGHHRVAALKTLKCRYVVANSIDYLSDRFRAKSWGRSKEWDREKIIEDALRGKLKEPRTTKNVLRVRGKELPLYENDIIEPVINYPLRRLK